MKSKPRSSRREEAHLSGHPLRLERGEGRGEVSKQEASAVAAFKAQVTQWAQKLRVRPRQVRIQRMRRKWASCSTGGTVSFSTDVLAERPAFREYVIVHELLHLKVPNHGKLFKTLLRAYLPDHELSRPGSLPSDDSLGGRAL